MNFPSHQPVKSQSRIAPWSRTAGTTPDLASGRARRIGTPTSAVISGKPAMSCKNWCMQIPLQGTINAQKKRISVSLLSCCDCAANRFKVPRIRSAIAHNIYAISHLAVLPPIWAALPSDLQLYPRPQPVEEPPELLLLDESSSCLCAIPRTEYNPLLATEQGTCVIYMMNRAQQTRMQLQHCPTCSPKLRRFIGPDLRTLGLFNYNNRALFTHDLLDDYTSHFTSSETPFAAWTLTVSRRYEVFGSAIPFVNEKMFRSAWFAYTHLQSLDMDMHCPKCGPDPQETIWDGVTLAFSQKHRLPSLRPPTTLDEKSLRRTEVRQRTGQQLIPDHDLRKDVRFVVQGSPLVEDFANNRSDDDEDTAGKSESRKAKQLLVSRVEKIPDVCKRLSSVNKPLAVLFNQYYGVARLNAGLGPPAEYQRLFVQVSADHRFVVGQPDVKLAFCRRVRDSDGQQAGHTCPVTIHFRTNRA
jgi:hypothetical protein